MLANEYNGHVYSAKTGSEPGHRSSDHPLCEFLAPFLLCAALVSPLKDNSCMWFWKSFTLGTDSKSQYGRSKRQKQSLTPHEPARFAPRCTYVTLDIMQYHPSVSCYRNITAAYFYTTSETLN